MSRSNARTYFEYNNPTNPKNKVVASQARDSRVECKPQAQYSNNPNNHCEYNNPNNLKNKVVASQARDSTVECKPQAQYCNNPNDAQTLERPDHDCSYLVQNKTHLFRQIYDMDTCQFFIGDIMVSLNKCGPRRSKTFKLKVWSSQSQRFAQRVDSEDSKQYSVFTGGTMDLCEWKTRQAI
jgi:hypothetical protein